MPAERERYSPGVLVIVTAGLVGGPIASVVTAIAAAHRFDDRRANVFWLSEAALVGVTAGVVGTIDLASPLRAAVTLAAVQALTLAALALVYRVRSIPDSRDALRGVAAVLLLVELVLGTPLLSLLSDAYDTDRWLVLSTVAALLWVGWMAQKSRDDYRRELSSERELARRDALTGLLNRRGSEEALAQEHARVERGGASAGLLLIDFDRFHWINQNHDLAGGDLVLRELSQRLATTLRAGDVVGRWGGEELIVIAPAMESAAISVLAEKARRIIRDTPVMIGEIALTVTCSVGATMLDGTAGSSVSLQRANRALKRAKDVRDTACVDSTLESRQVHSHATQVDSLTGLLNRQALAELVLPREVERSFQHGHPLALLLIDLDDLKKLNDRFGHSVGDLVLAGVADAITTVVGREDLVFRLGGDEFAVILPLEHERLLEQAHALLAAIDRRRFAGEGSTPAVIAHITATVGAAVLGTRTADVDPTLATQALLTTAEDAVMEGKATATPLVVKTALASDGARDVAESQIVSSH